jgi:hypothetical protein
VSLGVKHAASLGYFGPVLGWGWAAMALFLDAFAVWHRGKVRHRQLDAVDLARGRRRELVDGDHDSQPQGH